MKRALITGITGQDGRHLAQLLAGKGYQVFGLIRGQGNPKASIVQAETPSLELVDGDLRDLSSLIAVVERVQPDEVYNLGAISFVHLSFTQPELTAEITGLGVLRMLEAVRIVGGTATTRSASTRRRRRRCSARCARRPRTSSRRSTRGRRTAWPRCSATT